MGGCLSQLTAAPEAPEPKQIVPLKRSSQAETPRNSNFMDRLVSLESSRSPALPRYINSGYWPSYVARHERYPSKFDLTKLSHVFYAFASIDEEGALKCADEFVDFQLPVDGTNGCLSAWTQLKSQYPNLKVILSVGGEGASSKRFAWVGAEAQRREKFSASARHLLQLYNLDGIDLNWGDSASSQDGRHLLELVKTVRKSFKTKYMLTACFPATKAALERLPLSSLSMHLDLLNLMTYNFVDSSSAETGHHAQLSTRNLSTAETGQSCEIAVDCLKRNGVPPNKILLGIPLFGRSFLGNFANGPHEPFIQAGGTNGVHEVRNLPRPGTEEVYEDQLGAVWCCNGHEFVTYDSDESVFDKAWMVRDAGLAGLFYWHLGYDRAGEKSLVRKGWETLNESRGGHS